MDDTHNLFKELFARLEVEPKLCGNCQKPASSRCTRCKCQYYCSRQCQLEHFNQIHKSNCQAIGKARKKIDHQYNDVIAVGHGQVTSKLKLTVLKINLADLLVKVAYNECDKISHGRVFYCEALKIYASPFTDIFLEAHHCKRIFTFLEERARLVIIACGGGTMEFSRLAEKNQEGTFTYTWHMFWLLACIVKLSKYRENLGRVDTFQSVLNESIIPNSNMQGLPADDIAAHVAKYLIGDDKYLRNLPDDVRSAVEGVIRDDHREDLIRLKHASPFTREHSPGLFPGIGNALSGEMNMNPLDLDMILRTISFGGGAPPECWMIFQKCILDSFEGTEILQEFIQG